MPHINLTITDSLGTVITVGGDVAEEEALAAARTLVDFFANKVVEGPVTDA